MLTIIARSSERFRGSGHDYRLRNKPFMAVLQVVDFVFVVIRISSDRRGRDHP
ncbi:hypothetical protein [Brevundimonas sp.]|uniref:hypothetical protein n=1 Tax=Brevundimonas sp. TaxID=1871086 RepID=UPI003D6CC1E1